MVVTLDSSPFGSPARTRVLLALRLLGESYPRELARITDGRLSSVQRALQSLERDGLVAGRTVGRQRIFQLNPRYFAATELQPLLERLAQSDLRLERAVSQLRRRPRRTGKPI